MNSVNFKRSSDHKYPAIELDMTNFMEQLSDKCTFPKAEVRDDGVQTNPNSIDCRTGYTDATETCSISEMGFEREEKVKDKVKFVILSCTIPMNATLINYVS